MYELIIDGRLATEQCDYTGPLIKQLDNIAQWMPFDEAIIRKVD